MTVDASANAPSKSMGDSSGMGVPPLSRHKLGFNPIKVRAVIDTFRYVPLEVSFGRLMALYDQLPCHVIGAPVLSTGDISLPRWNGEPVKRLLVIKEPTGRSTAFGELFHFGRYLVEARKRCETLTLCFSWGAEAVAKRCLLVDDLCEMNDLDHALRQADAYVVLGLHLAYVMAASYGEPSPITSIPARVPALDRARQHIGLCWAGSGAYNYGDNRIETSDLHALKTAFDRPITFHSLQVGAAAGAAAGARPNWVTSHELTDWDDTIGLVDALDSVVTVDTGVAHLAASMGKPTHLILEGREEWRWGTASTTPWYPSMQIYRGGLKANLTQLVDALAIDVGACGMEEAVPAIRPEVLGAVTIPYYFVRPIYMSAIELGSIVALLQRVGAKSVLEIGVNEGRTAKALLDQMPQLERYVGVDVLPGYKFARTRQDREVPSVPGRFALPESRFELLLRARGAFDLRAEDLGSFDAVFIDGDHGLEAVRHDTELARSIVRPGGVILWHDYCNPYTPDVRVVLDELRRARRDVRRVAGTWLAFEFVPCASAGAEDTAPLPEQRHLLRHGALGLVDTDGHAGGVPLQVPPIRQMGAH